MDGWSQKLKDVRIPTEWINGLVMDYLATEVRCQHCSVCMYNRDGYTVDFGFLEMGAIRHVQLLRQVCLLSC